MKKFTVRLLAVILVLSVLLTLSCSGNNSENDNENEPTAYERADCLFTPPEGYDIECGYLTVPENRSLTDGNTIKIYFAIFRTQNENPEPDPIVYLAGGPGENALETASLIFEKRFAPFMENRDLIIYDQRGTGYSEPSLFCSELVDVYFENLDKDVSLEESTAMHIDTLKRCHDRFIDDGIDLSAYTTAESAADLEDLRQALGYEEWNLLSVSYGTRLALTAMRDHPEGVRSVVLASTVPLQTDVYTELPDTFNRSLDVLFDACAADPAGNAAYPELEATLYEAVDKLNDDPAVMLVPHPLTLKFYEVVMDGYDFLDFIFEMLYSTEVLPVLPKTIYDAADGNYDTIALLLSSSLVNVELISTGMHYAVQFNEELPFNDPDEITAAIAEYPAMEEYLRSGVDDDGRIWELFEYWNAAEPDPIEDQAVSSDIPTLIFAGEYDPVTPPAWGRFAAETLAESTFIELPGISHDTVFSRDECVLDMTLGFFDDPEATIDVACVAGIETPEFTVLDIDLAPFANEFYGLAGLYPANWIEMAPGAWQRTRLGFTALIEQNGTGIDADQFLDMMANSLGVIGDLEQTDTRKTKQLEWKIYHFELQGLTNDIMVAEKDETLGIILFSCVGDDYDYYYENLLIPVIDAYTLTIE